MKALQSIFNFLTGYRHNNVSDNLKQFRQIPDKVFAYQKSLKNLTQSDIITHINSLQESDADDKLVATFAAVAEGFNRLMGITPYPEQLIAAVAMADKNIIEMQTGEGKTIAAVFTACLEALNGNKVHVFTFNDYLAERDANWMRSIYEFMGLTVSFSGEEFSISQKRQAYQADICYTTAKTIGFDFLRATMAYEVSEQAMPPFGVVIVDEADAILIDEARNPLVLAGSFDFETVDLYAVARFVNTLEYATHFQTDEYSRNVYLTEAGTTHTESHFNSKGLHFEESKHLLTAVNLALQARVLLKRDVDYIISGGRIKLVDELTGRVVEDRMWQNGLQAAVEAMEGLTIVSEGKILNSITLQHLINQYDKVCGMTGTAINASDEFARLYGIGVYIIPPHKPSLRIDLPDMVFTHKSEKLNAILKEVKTIHQTGRPILIGTLTIQESEELHDFFNRYGIMSVVLNAKNDASEAAVIENAGLPGAVTISTNMAGRGTDILLGGKDGVYKEEVIGLGGLHVIGTNRHESLRIDRQLKGRAGRQGDPGSSQFIISMDDPLMKKYGLKELLPKKLQGIEKSGPISNATINYEIARAQRIIEGQLFEIRKTLCDYAQFTENQRMVHFAERQRIMYESNSGNNAFIKFMLFQYDQHWSDFLNEIASIREGIAWERMAGRNPLREFFFQSDQLFNRMQEQLMDLAERVRHQKQEDLEIKKPSSTWTYVINDSPSSNPLAATLFNAGNIGMQMDLIAAPMLMLSHWLSKKKK